MSYTIDIYKGKIIPEKNILYFAAFVAFFPELVAGPIVRAEKLIPQLYREVKPTWVKFKEGLKWFILGLFKKLFMADMISPISDNVFAHFKILSGYEVCIGVIAYTIQIYCDFSGYTDMAIGIAKMMDYDFPENFNIPYVSKSITEFWRRWHMSMSTWFNDYLFTPLTYSMHRFGEFGMLFTIIFTFTLIGLWHGADWKFVIFGLLQGVALVYEFVTKKKRKRIFKVLPQPISNFLSIVFTLCYIMFTLVFFRAQDFTSACGVLKKLGDFHFKDIYYIPQFYLLLLTVIVAHYCYQFVYDKDKKWRLGKLTEQMVYIWMIIMMLVMAPTHTSPFVYFQF